MDRLTCLTCQVSLPSSESQREHYKSEWHLYNLKRKLNQLKSITEDEFQEIKNKLFEQQMQQELLGKTDPSFLYCQVCGKSFLNLKAFEQHNASNKHQRQLALAEKVGSKKSDDQSPVSNISQKQDVQKSEEIESLDDEAMWSEVDSDEEILESIPVEECLFCGHVSRDISSNLSHMSIKHSFFIPDIEYCTDLKGLLKYLGTKIASGHCCLWCSDNGKSFASKKSAQQHMIDVGHTKINFHNRPESLLEFEDFYDYSSSYPEDMQEEDPEEEIELPVLDDDDYELKLPSGAVIGHRALSIYYKQKLRPKKPSVPLSGDRSNNRELMNNVASQYRSLGWVGNVQGPIAIQMARDIHYVNRIKQKMNLKLGQRNNIVKQTHFRSQTGF